MSFQRAGYVFESEVERGLALASPYYFKIPDTKMVGYVNHILKQNKMHPIIFPKVPADFIAHGDSGQTYYLECKSTLAKSFPLINVKEHQLLEGYTLDNIGEPLHYYFIIQMKYHDEIILISPKVILDALKSGVGSIPIEILHEKGRILQRLTAKHHPDKKGAFVQLDEEIK